MHLSIIIPTLNEAGFLQKTIDNLYKNAQKPELLEVIIIDSGSQDQTPQIAQENKTCLFHAHPELKGKKYAILNKGTSYAKGDILLFLDADTLLPKNYDEIIYQTFSKGFIGGAFEFKLDGYKLSLRFIELVNRIRYRIEQRYFGDQAIFCDIKIFHQVGGFPGRGILESAYLCKLLRKKGRLKLIKKNAITSSRRFESHQYGPVWVLIKDSKAYILDKLGYKNEAFAKKYWNHNDQLK